MPLHLFPFINPFLEEDQMSTTPIPLFDPEKLKESGAAFLKDAPPAAKAELEKVIVENAELVKVLGKDFITTLFKKKVIEQLHGTPEVREGITLAEAAHWSSLAAAEGALGEIIAKESADKSEHVGKAVDAMKGAVEKTANIILGMARTAALGF